MNNQAYQKIRSFSNPKFDKWTRPEPNIQSNSRNPPPWCRP